MTDTQAERVHGTGTVGLNTEADLPVTPHRQAAKTKLGRLAQGSLALANTWLNSCVNPDSGASRTARRLRYTKEQGKRSQRVSYLVEMVELDHGVSEAFQVAPKRRVQLEQRRIESAVNLLKALSGGGVDEE